MALGRAHFRVVASSICLPLPPRAGRTPRPVDKLSGFFTEKKGSWGVSFGGHVHSPPGPPPLQNPHPVPRPACPCNLSWIYCEFEKEKRVYSYLAQLPDTWVMGEGTGVTLGPARTGGEAPSQPTQEPLSRSPPSAASTSVQAPRDSSPPTIDHMPLQYVSFRSIYRPVRRHEWGFPRRTWGAPRVCKEGWPRKGG